MHVQLQPSIPVSLDLVPAVRPAAALAKKAAEVLQRRRTGCRRGTKRKADTNEGREPAPLAPTPAMAGTPEGRWCALCLLGQPLPDFCAFPCAWECAPAK